MEDIHPIKYEFNYYPNDKSEHIINLEFYATEGLHCAALQRMCKAFAYALGYNSKTIDEYFGEDRYDDFN